MGTVRNAPTALLPSIYLGDLNVPLNTQIVKIIQCPLSTLGLSLLFWMLQ
jgi:hypothetical protein